VQDGRITPLSTETATSPRTVWEELNAVQIRVSLDGVEPAIYRGLVVPLDNTRAQLHHILQAAMGWTDSHLHQFEIGGLRFGDPELPDGLRLHLRATARLPL
jgi:hypothetical protein